MKKIRILILFSFVFASGLEAAIGSRLNIINDIGNKYLHIFIFRSDKSSQPIFETVLDKKGTGNNEKRGYVWDYGKKIKPGAVLRYYASEFKEENKDFVFESLPEVTLQKKYFEINTITTIKFSWEDGVKVQVESIRKNIIIGGSNLKKEKASK